MKKEERKQLWGEQDRPQCRSDRLNGEPSRVPLGAEMLSHWLRAAGKSVALTQKLRQRLKVLTAGHSPECPPRSWTASVFLEGKLEWHTSTAATVHTCALWSTCSGSSFFQVSVASVHEGKLKRGKLGVNYSPHCCSWFWGCICCSRFPSYTIHSKFLCFQLAFPLGLVPYLVVWLKLSFLWGLSPW